MKIWGTLSTVIICALMGNAPVQAASISGRIDCAGMTAKVMAVPSNKDEKEARWGTLDRFGTEVGRDGTYRISGLEKGTYDLVIGVYLPGRGYPVHHVVALSLKARLNAQAEKNGDREEIEKTCRLIEGYSRAHDPEISKKLFAADFVRDFTIKMISPVHNKKVFIDNVIEKAEIAGLASDGRRANVLLKLELATKGKAKVKLHGGSYTAFVREGKIWRVINSKMLWRTREENPIYPVKYTLDKNLTNILLADDKANSSGHNYRFDMPMIRITAPSKAVSTVKTAEYVVKGSIVIPAGGKVTGAAVNLVNRKVAGPTVFPIELNERGGFDCNIKLGPGVNDLQVWAADEKGHKVYTGTLRVNRGN